MSTEIHNRILSEIRLPLARMAKETRGLFVDLASDLASTGRIRMRDHAVETDEEEEVLKLFLLL